MAINKVKAVLILETIIVVIFILKCFGNCEQYTLDKNDFNQCFNGDLIYFDDGSIGIEAQGLGEFDIVDSTLWLRSGAYSINVYYESVSNYESTSIDNIGGKVVFETYNPSLLKSSVMELREGLNEAQSRFWIRNRFRIRPGSGKNEIKIHIRYCDNGKLVIKEIRIQERREYRVLTCIAVIGAMMACNLLFFYFIKTDDTPSIQRKRIVIAAIAGITILSSLTYFTDFLYGAHDRDFHLSRIASLATALKEFQIPHRIQFEMLNGYGYATPLYYGEAFLLLPALLMNLYLPLQTCYQIFVIFVNFMTCFISYWCFMRMSGDWKKGLLGSFVYTLAAYRLTNVMVRAAVGEYTAMVFFPLLIYGIWHIYRKGADEKISTNDCMPVIIAATGILNAHILSCEMVVFFVILFAVFNYRKTFRKNIITALMKSVLYIILLNAWFIIPFIQSMGMNITVNNSANINWIESGKVYPSQLFGVFHTARGTDVWLSTQNEMPLSIGLPLLIGIGLLVVVYIKKEEWHLYKDQRMQTAATCFALGLLAMFLSSNLCRWDNLIYIGRGMARVTGMVQFPWRYLGIATVFLTVLLVYVLQIMEENISASAYRQIVLVLIVCSVITEGYFFMEYADIQDERRIYSEADIGTMTVMNAEYLLQGTDINVYKDRMSIQGGGITCSELYYDRNGKYHLTCSNKMDVQDYIDLPIQAYDNYHAYTDNGVELCVITGENNKVRVLIPGNYEGTIWIKYVVPVLWRLCELISLGTICFIVFVSVLYGRRKNI